MLNVNIRPKCSPRVVPKTYRHSNVLVSLTPATHQSPLRRSSADALRLARSARCHKQQRKWQSSIQVEVCETPVQSSGRLRLSRATERRWCSSSTSLNPAPFSFKREKKDLQFPLSSYFLFRSAPINKNSPLFRSRGVQQWLASTALVHLWIWLAAGVDTVHKESMCWCLFNSPHLGNWNCWGRGGFGERKEVQ